MFFFFNLYLSINYYFIIYFIVRPAYIIDQIDYSAYLSNYSSTVTNNNKIAMNSIGEECTELKKKYDDCFNNWFSEKFLKGNHDDTVCSGMFKVYQECVKNAMKKQNIDFKELDKNVLGTENENKAPPSSSS